MVVVPASCVKKSRAVRLNERNLALGCENYSGAVCSNNHLISEW
jgi:hypothetical protein